MPNKVVAAVDCIKIPDRMHAQIGAGERRLNIVKLAHNTFVPASDTSIYKITFDIGTTFRETDNDAAGIH